MNSSSARSDPYRRKRPSASHRQNSSVMEVGTSPVPSSLCATPLIMKVFIKHKILSVDTLLSAYTSVHTHTHTHTHARTHARTYTQRCAPRFYKGQPCAARCNNALRFPAMRSKVYHCAGRSSLTLQEPFCAPRSDRPILCPVVHYCALLCSTVRPCAPMSSLYSKDQPCAPWSITVLSCASRNGFMLQDAAL